MTFARRFPASVLLVAILLARAAGAGLVDYVHKDDGKYSWTQRSIRELPGGKAYDLRLTSQEWHGIRWTHRLSVFVPTKVEYPRFCLLYNTGGDGSPEEALIGIETAKSTGCLVAIVYNVPNQPLFDGKSEDALIADTWKRYIETGDDTWPLQLPMVKSVVKAMDAVQDWAKKEKRPAVTGFAITGASKRGWTAWLTGAVEDKRVKGIAPMVFDMLDMPAQLEHQKVAYGKPSEQIHDYTSVNLDAMVNTPGGKRLVALTDPYAYRERLKMPKLMIMGTNDRYWTLDSLNLYWDGLPVQKWVIYAPNSGHGLQDRVRVFEGITAFTRSLASGKPLPKVDWKTETNGGKVTLIAKADPKPSVASVWSAASPTRDFRDATWASTPLPVTDNGASVPLELPESGWSAKFIELTFNVDGRMFRTATQVTLLQRADAKTDKP